MVIFSPHKNNNRGVANSLSYLLRYFVKFILKVSLFPFKDQRQEDNYITVLMRINNVG